MKKLIVVLFLIGGILMISLMDAFLKNTAENIVHRKNLTTGIIKVVNANLSFDVEIGSCGKITKQIFTLSPEPDLAVDDEVLIGCLKGNKEAPIIFAPTISAVAAIVRRYALIVAYPDEIQAFNMNGTLIAQLAVSGWSYSGCALTMDSRGNIYLNDGGEWIRKYDSNLNLLISLEVDDWLEGAGLAIGSDGYLYSLEMIDEGYDVKKRNVADLTVDTIIPITDSIYYAYASLCLDSDGNIYVFNDPYIEKYSNTGVLLAQLETDGLSNEFAGLGVCGSNIYFVKGTRKIYYAPLSLASYSEWDLPDAIAYSLTIADGHLILSGWGTGGAGATRKYDSDRNLIWEEFLGGSTYGYKAGAYNF